MWNIIGYAAYFWLYIRVLQYTQNNMKKLGIKYNDYNYIQYYGLDGEEHFLIPQLKIDE